MEGPIEESAVLNMNATKIFLGVLIGGIAGAAALWVFVAQSTKRARTSIRLQGSRWMERAADIADLPAVQSRKTTGGGTAGNMTVHIA